MRRPREASIVTQQQFAPPDRTVAAQPQPIKDDPGHGPTRQRPAIFNQTGRKMRMVVLHFEHHPAGAIYGMLRGSITRVQIAGKHLGLMVEQLGIVGIRFHELFPCQRLIQVTQMVRKQRLTVLDQADRRFQMRPERDHLRRFFKAFGQR